MRGIILLMNVRIPRLGIALLSGLFLNGCADLQAVREFSKTSAATADYRQIVGVYVGSPQRQKRYQPERLASQLDGLGEARARQKGALEAAQAILVQYMSALGDLAVDDLPKVDAEFDAFGKALEKAKLVGDAEAPIKKETATAAATIAKVLTRAVLDHWRRSQLSRIIRETDDSIQTVVAGLREIVLVDFDASLAAEAEGIRKYFEKPIAAGLSGSEPDVVPPLARILMQERLEVIQTQRDQLKAYAEVLKKIGSGHSDLRANVTNLDDKALKERLQQYARDLRVLYKAVAAINA